MTENNNTTNSENQPIRETVDFNASACKYRHKTTDEKVDSLENKTNEKIDNLKNKIEVETKKTIEKMERFDEKIRGNGHIGIEEQIRDINEVLQKDIDKKLEEATKVREANKENIVSLIILKDRIYLLMKIIRYILYIGMAFCVIMAGGSAMGLKLPEGIGKALQRARSAFFYNPEKEKKDIERLKGLIKEVIIEQDSLKESIKEQGKELKKNEDNINRIENNNE